MLLRQTVMPMAPSLKTDANSFLNLNATRRQRLDVKSKYKSKPNGTTINENRCFLDVQMDNLQNITHLDETEFDGRYGSRETIEFREYFYKHVPVHFTSDGQSFSGADVDDPLFYLRFLFEQKDFGESETRSQGGSESDNLQRTKMCESSFDLCDTAYPRWSSAEMDHLYPKMKPMQKIAKENCYSGG